MLRIILFLMLLLIPINEITAEDTEIPITYSTTMEKIIFDGKWTFFSEWKHSSLETIGNESVVIRVAHFENYVFVLIDAVFDSTYNRVSDKAMICFDTLNNKSLKPESDDYCFVSIMGKTNGYVLQGGSVFAANDYMYKIKHISKFIAVGSMSDKNDRYSKQSHASYEFKIPTDLIGRDNEYGFYVQVFDSNSNSFHTWPVKIKTSDNLPPPSSWGTLISIDNSLPEFHTFVILLIIPLSLIIIFSHRKSIFYA